jgi:hypothetical protein
VISSTCVADAHRALVRVEQADVVRPGLQDVLAGQQAGPRGEAGRQQHVAGEARADQRLQRQRGAAGGGELAVAGHRPRQVDQHHAGAAARRGARPHADVVLVEVDEPPGLPRGCGQRGQAPPLGRPSQGLAQRLVQVEMVQRRAGFARAGLVARLGADAGTRQVVPAGGALAARAEQLSEQTLLARPHRQRGQLDVALPGDAEEAGLDQGAGLRAGASLLGAELVQGEAALLEHLVEQAVKRLAGGLGAQPAPRRGGGAREVGERPHAVSPCGPGPGW